MVKRDVRDGVVLIGLIANSDQRRRGHPASS